MSKYNTEYQAEYREMHRVERRGDSKKRYHDRIDAGLCTQCGKPNDGPFVQCSECRSVYRQYKHEYDKTPEGKEASRTYAAKRRKTSEYRAWRRDYMKRRRREDMQFKMACRLTDRLNKALRGIGSGQDAVRYLGCSLEELKVHLSEQFEIGMTWENHGEWHIDHIIPFASIDLTKEKELRKVCHYTNLQPLWAADNIRKGDKVEWTRNLAAFEHRPRMEPG